MKFRYTKLQQGHILVCNVTQREGFNRREIELLGDPPEGVMKVLSFDEEKLTVIFDASRCVPLSLYLKRNLMTEEELLIIVRQIVSVMENLEKNRLTVQKLVPDIKYAFYNVNKRMLELVFCPVQNNYSPLESKQIFGFMQDIISGAKLSSDSGRIKEFIQFIRKQKNFSAADTASFLDSNTGDISSFQLPAEPPDTMTMTGGEFSEPEALRPKEPSLPPCDAFIRNDRNGLDFPITAINCVIGRIGVDGNGVTISPDIALTSNKRVGKRHALIFRDGTTYYIVDLGSKNGTRINGMELPAGYDPISRRFNGICSRLENGSKIQLAGESFTFYIVQKP